MNLHNSGLGWANASRLVVRRFMGIIADSREQPKTGKVAPGGCCGAANRS